VSVAKKTFTGSTVWVAVGLEGTIYRSGDDGLNWSSISSGTTEDLNQVIYDSDNVSFDHFNFLAVGNNGTVLKSIDGSSWSAMNFPSNTNLMTIAAQLVFSGGDRANLWIIGANGKIYYSAGHSGAYSSWVEWEYPPSNSLSNAPSAVSTFFGCDLVLNGYGVLGGFDTVGFEINDEVEASLYGVYLTGLGGGVVRPGANSMCTFDPTGTGAAPVIVVNFKDFNKNQADNYLLTSVDGGVSWSTIQVNERDFGNLGEFGERYPVFVGGEIFPICSDGTDVFLALGSNWKAVAPYVVKTSGWVISLQEAEVI
jgi:photosystem II stability/assembly factor-like uncharacterized protein